MSGKRYGIGVIGCGVIWRVGHWPGLKEMPDEAEVRWVYDLEERLTQEAARETGARAARDAEEILGAADVDIVALLTPPDVRVEHVQKACAAGKHLMLEKPMARTLEQALAIFNEVRRRKVKCFIPFGRAVNEQWQRLVALLRSGELGEPLVFVHNYLAGPYPWIPLDHWMHDQARSGGPIFDYSVHFIDLARACLGAEAEEVYYGGAATTGRVKSDDQATLLIYYQGGKFGQFTKSWAFPPAVKLAQQSGYVVCREGVVSLLPQIEITTAQGTRPLEPAAGEANGRAESYRNLIAAIERDTPLYADELDGLRSIEILAAGLRSRETGARERVVRHGS
jgi:predicted dehydrogenase